MESVATDDSTEEQMSLTRKRQKELKRLRSGAEDLWSQQQEVLANANALAAEARKQAAYYTREEIAPRVREGYDNYVVPTAQAAPEKARSSWARARIPVGSGALTIGCPASAPRRAAFPERPRSVRPPRR